MNLLLERLEDRWLPSASVFTNKPDYAPGETALINGEGFQVGETVDLQVLHTDGTPNTGNGHEVWQVVDGGASDLDGLADGKFLTTWYVDPDDSFGSTFELTAQGNLGSQASTTFTDDVTNGSFESSLSGWTASSSPLTAAVSSHPNYLPVQGNKFARLATGGGTGVYTTLSQTITINSGDVGRLLSGYAFFDTSDQLPPNDDGYVKITSIDGTTTTLFSSSVSAVGDNGRTPWTYWDYTFTTAGTYTIEAGVRNVGDNTGVSYLGLDNVTVISTPAATVVGDNLVVVGRNIADSIVVNAPTTGAIGVTINGQSLGTFAIAATGRVIVRGRGGDDTITATGTVPFEIYGGDGADVITGGNGNDTLTGGNGLDTFTGGLGNDVFVGQAGDGDRVAESAAVNFTLTATSLTGRGTDTLSNIDNVDLVGNDITVNGFSGVNLTIDGDTVTVTGAIAATTVTLEATEDVALNAPITASTVTIQAGGAILDGNGTAVNITTSTLTLTAGAGIGTASDRLETVTSGGSDAPLPTLSLTASGGTGGIFLTNQHSLTILSASAAGIIDIEADGPLFVVGDIASATVNPDAAPVIFLTASDIDITGDIDISGDIDLTGDIDFSGDIDFAGDLDIAGDLDVSGDLDIGGDLDLAGDLDMSGDLDVFGDLQVFGAFNRDFDLAGDLDIGGDLFITGTFLGDLDIAGDLDIGGDIDIAGDIIISEASHLDIDLSGDLDIGGDIDIAGDIKIFGSDHLTLNFHGDVDIGGDLAFVGDLDISGDIDVGGDIDVSGDLDIAGDILVTGNFLNDLDLSGDIDVSGDLDIAGDIRIVNATNLDLDFGGDLDLNGDLDVSGDLDLSGDIIISSASNLDIDFQGDIDFSGDIDILGDNNSGIHFVSSGDLDLAGDLDITGDIVISANHSSDIDFGGDIDLFGDIDIVGDHNSDIDFSGDLDIVGDIVIGGVITNSAGQQVTIGNFNSDIDIAGDTFAGLISIGGNTNSGIRITATTFEGRDSAQSDGRVIHLTVLISGDGNSDIQFVADRFGGGHEGEGTGHEHDDDVPQITVLISGDSNSNIGFTGQTFEGVLGITGDFNSDVTFTGGSFDAPFFLNGNDVSHVTYTAATLGGAFTINGNNASHISYTAGVQPGAFTIKGDNASDITYTTFGSGGVLEIDGDSASAITFNGAAAVDTLLIFGDDSTGVTFTAGNGGDVLVVAGDDAGVVFDAGSGDDRVNLSGANVSAQLLGGSGSDRYDITGPASGAVTIVEGASADSDTIDFSSFARGGVTLDLASTASQVVYSGLTLTLSNSTGIENVVGTGFADTLSGNSLGNSIQGSDLLDDRVGTSTWNGRTQVVLLDFDTYTNQNDAGTGEHIYTAQERAAIEARIEADYSLFHYVITQDASEAQQAANANAAPGDRVYAVIYFNQTPPDIGLPGGQASEIDWRNLHLGGVASVQGNGILGVANQPADTSENWVALSAKIGAHELAHLVGVRHQDAYGPIGYGIHTPPGATAYSPAYPGPSGGYETFNHLIASGASMGTNRFIDVENDLFFGEREAIKIAFAESGTVVQETSLALSADGARVLGVLPALSVPNTVLFGLNAGKQLAVAAVNVIGTIGTAGESDRYAFTGRKGDLINVEIASANQSRYDGLGIHSVVRVYDASGQLVSYYTGTAENSDLFEEGESGLIDLILPADGTYYIEVSAQSDDPTGIYELLVFRFDAGNVGDAGDRIEGRAGDDELSGGEGNDVYVFSGGGLGSDTVREDVRFEAQGGAVGSRDGRDLIDLSTLNSAVTVDLARTDSQTVSAGNLILKLSSALAIEDVFGTQFSDTLKGNARNNLMWGGAGGNDLLEGRDGNDTFVFENGTGTTTVVGGAGKDTLDFGGQSDSPWRNFTTRTAGVTVDLSKTNTSQAVGGGLSINQAGDVENVHGSMLGSNTLTGNSLNNRLVGGAGNDTMVGASGDDILIGGDGDDRLTGGDGRDLMIGGFGADQITGSSGDDLLIAGRTIYDYDSQFLYDGVNSYQGDSAYTALDAIFAEWTSSRDYATRIANINNLATQTADRLNGNYYLTEGAFAAGFTVDSMDNVVDRVTGQGGTDWYILAQDGTTVDIITDNSTNGEIRT